MARQSDDVPSITTALAPLSEDISGRTRRYLVSMGIRTACFLAAIVTTGWLRYTLLVGAVLLPYLAVVIANAGREPNRSAPVTLLVGPAAISAPTTTSLPRGPAPGSSSG